LPFDCSAIHFNTLPFFYPHKDNPSGRPPVHCIFIVGSSVLVTVIYSTLLLNSSDQCATTDKPVVIHRSL